MSANQTKLFILFFSIVMVYSTYGNIHFISTSIISIKKHALTFSFTSLFSWLYITCLHNYIHIVFHLGASSSVLLCKCLMSYSCHHVADSLFSTSSGFNDYRGLLNLCIVLLVRIHFQKRLNNKRLNVRHLISCNDKVSNLS